MTEISVTAEVSEASPDRRAFAENLAEEIADILHREQYVSEASVSVHDGQSRPYHYTKGGE